MSFRFVSKHDAATITAAREWIRVDTGGAVFSDLENCDQDCETYDGFKIHVASMDGRVGNMPTRIQVLDLIEELRYEK
jgi:hypothetical protein